MFGEKVRKHSLLGEAFKTLLSTTADGDELAGFAYGPEWYAIDSRIGRFRAYRDDGVRGTFVHQPLQSQRAQNDSRRILPSAAAVSIDFVTDSLEYQHILIIAG